MSKTSGYFLRARYSTMQLFQSASADKSRAYSSGLISSSLAKTKSDTILSVFQTSEQNRLTRTASTYPFPSHKAQLLSTPLAPPKNIFPIGHDGMGPSTSPVNAGPIATSSTVSFVQSLLVGNTAEKETAYVRSPKRARVGPHSVRNWAAPSSMPPSPYPPHRKSGERNGYCNLHRHHRVKDGYWAPRVPPYRHPHLF